MAISIPRNLLGGGPSTGGTWNLTSVTTSPVSERWFIKYTTDIAHSIYTSTACPSVALPYSLGAGNDDPYLDTDSWTPGTYIFQYQAPITCGPAAPTNVTITISDSAELTALTASPHTFCNTSPTNTTLTATVFSKRDCATSLPAPYGGAPLIYTFQQAPCPSGAWTNLAPPQSSNVYVDGTIGYSPSGNSNYYKFYRVVMENSTPIVCNAPTNMAADNIKQESGLLNSVVDAPCTDVCLLSTDFSKIINFNDYWVAGTAAPIPRSCTAGQGANFKYIDLDGNFGAAGATLDCKTSSSDLVSRDFVSFTDGLDVRIGYRVTNHLTIPITNPIGCPDLMPNWNLNCNEEVIKIFNIVKVAGGSGFNNYICDGSFEDLPNGIIGHNVTYNMWSDLLLAPSLTNPVRTYTWRLSSFTNTFPGHTTPYYNLCGQGYMNHSVGPLPTTGCGTPSTGTTIAFDIGIPNGTGVYVFVLEALNPGCAAGCPPTQHFLTIETIFS